MKTKELTEELLKNWIRARKSRERCEAQLIQSQDEEVIAVNQLGRWLCPADSKSEEPFNIWIGSGVLEAKMLKDFGDGSNYSICWRKEPDGKDRFENGF